MVRGLVFDPFNPGRVYLGTRLGGVLLSNDEGLLWTPLNYRSREDDVVINLAIRKAGAKPPREWQRR